MDHAELQSKIEEISEAIVLVEPSDSKTLNGLHGMLREVASAAEAAGFFSLAVEAKKVGRIIEKLVFDAPANATEVLQEAGQIISGMQSTWRDSIAQGAAASKPEASPTEQQPAEAVPEGEAFADELAGVNIVDPVEEPEVPMTENDSDGEIAAEQLVPAASGEAALSASASSPEVKEPATQAAARPSFLPENADMEIFTEFLSRQPSVLEEMEEVILDLDRACDEAHINKIKRLIHTMKGESGLLGLNDVQKVCHATETLLEEGAAHARFVDILLAVKDWLSRTFAAYSGKGIEPGPADVLLELLFEANWVEPEDGKEEEAEAPEPEPEAIEAPQEIESAPPETEVLLNDADTELLNDFINEASEHLDNVEAHMLTLETTPEDETSLNAVFRAFHTIKGVAGYLALDQIGHLAHDVESLLDRARKGELLLKGRAIDALFESVDMMKQLVSNVKEAMSNGTPLAYEPGVNSLIDQINQVTRGTKGAPAAASGPKAPAQPKQVASPPSAPKQGPTSPAAQPAQAPARTGKAEEAEAPAKAVGDAQFVQVRESIKVDADRLDRLIDTIGELVITESMVSQMMRDKYSDAHMMSNLSQLDKITRQLQEMSTSLRMVPVRATFQKMARLVRDLAKKSGKRIDFIMSGEDTELDKSVVDKIGDPLVHMIRNSVDHGIESAADRAKAGKSEVGRVELRAFHKGGSIFIEVVDDGKGLARDRILAKAIENGLINEGASLSEKEIYGLIFQPGFSTATVVTDVSGRGIGMDVVRRNIESLRGRIEIQTTPGAGSVFSIRLPLTLAIIDGMMVGVGEERYIIPTLSIVRSLRPEKESFSSVQGRGEMYSLDGMMIPVFYLNRLFGVENAQESVVDGLLVVVENDGLYTGLVVDELFGQHQIVIKTLGRLLQGIPGISGSTIMTDGHVALILDIAGLVKLANRERLGAGV